MVILAMPVAIASLAAAAVGPSFADCDASTARVRTESPLAVTSAERLKIRMHRLDEILGEKTEAGLPGAGGAAGGTSKDGESADAERTQALGATFDRSRSAPTSADVDAGGGVPMRRPVTEGIGGSCALMPMVSSEFSTDQALAKLSPWQQLVAKKAIPVIDELGQRLGVYSMLQSMGVNEPRVFVLSLIQNESAFSPGAVSPARAVGLMQVLPETANGMGVHGDLKDIRTNVEAGMKFLNYSLRELGRPDYALAGYNAGVDGTRQSLARSGRIPQITETVNYVKSIFKTYTSWLGNKWSAFSSQTLASLY